MSFFNLFGKTKPKKSNDSIIPETYSYILFLLDDKNEPYIKMAIADTSKEGTVAFSDLVHHLCTGNYTESILRVLLDMRYQDEHIHACVKNIVLELMKLKKLNNDAEDSPQIKPTQFCNKNV